MRAFLMKKLFSLLLVLALALVPTLSLADDDAACQNLYNMLLDELKSVDLEMTADEESYRIYLGYALDKNSLGDADVIFDAYSDAVTINVSYSNPLDEALVPQVISFFNRVNSTLYVGKLMIIKSDNVWYAAYVPFYYKSHCLLTIIELSMKKCNVSFCRLRQSGTENDD